jgi:hypothetical protein
MVIHVTATEFTSCIFYVGLRLAQYCEHIRFNDFELQNFVT